MIQRFRIGNNLSIIWLLYEEDGNIHNLEGKEIELYMVCGGYKHPVTDYTITENAIAWTFPAAIQTRTGYYKLVLLERDATRGLYSFDVAQAFCLEPRSALRNIKTIVDEDATVQVRSVLTYAHITNLASIDTVTSEDGKSATVVVHLTNGKSFTLPFNPGTGEGGSGTPLTPATADRLGGLKVGFVQDGDKYPVRLNTQSHAYVEIPGARGVTVHDGLYSTSTEDALSANMGRVIREMIESLPSGGGSGSNGPTYRLYYDDLPEGERRQGSPIVLWRFKSSSNYWDRIPSTGDIAMVFDGSGTVHCFELSVIEDEEEEGGLYITSNSTLRQFSLNVADLNGGGGSSQPGEPGDPGRSITSVQNWYKLCADESVQATQMDVADPSSSAGGSWSLTAGSPSVEYPYLRCFMQVNYDTPLENGYTYTRSSAFTARYYNAQSNADYDELVQSLANLRAELLADLQGYETDLSELTAALDALRNTISGSISTQLTELRNRLNEINGTDVELIKNNGLWAVMTSWVSATGNKKAFADIILNAETAKALIQTGSTFFDHSVGGEFTLDGLIGLISGKVTRQDVNAMIASAQFSVDPSSLNSVISKSQACWKKDGLLYPYDLYLDDFLTANPSGTLADYETYMQKTAANGGPAGDTNRPAGAFELVVVVEQFSSIQQTVDQISASIDTTKYMWHKDGHYYSYDNFQTEYAARAAAYTSYTYEQYVQNVLLYTRVEVGTALSNITQTSGEIRSILGDMGYYWTRTDGGTQQYERYAVPSNKTRAEYVSEMQTAGWRLVSFASKMSVIDQFPDSITSLVKNSTLVWIKSTETGAAYCRDYDYWLTEYNSEPRVVTYEEYVPVAHTGYVLTVVTNSFSRIKQTADSISSAVTRIDGHEERLSSVEQSAEEISLAVTKSRSCWRSNVNGTLEDYEHFRSDYNTYKESAINPVDYEDWVENTQNYTLTNAFEAVSGIKIQSDKIWAAVGDGDDVLASIEILAQSDVDEETGSKIILDATNVQINGGLQAGVVNAGAIASGAVTTDKLDAGAVTAGKIDANAITAAKIQAGAVTTDKLAADAVTAAKIAAGTITADKLASGVIRTDFLETALSGGSKVTIENGLIVIRDSDNNIRIKIGQEVGDGTPVLKFYSEDDDENPLYDLGPAGILQSGGPVTIPEWTKYKAVRKSAQGGRFDANGTETIVPSSAVGIYKYEAGYRLLESPVGSGHYAIQYMNPFDMRSYSGNEPAINGDYFSQYRSRLDAETYDIYLLPLGDYILMPIAENRTTGRITADVVRITMLNGARHVNTNLEATFTMSGDNYILQSIAPPINL